MTGCGHVCCDERTDPHHDHFLPSADCVHCQRMKPPKVDYLRDRYTLFLFQVEQRYQNDPAFHARVHRALEIVTEGGVGSFEEAIAVGLLMAEYDPTTCEPAVTP